MVQATDFAAKKPSEINFTNFGIGASDEHKWTAVFGGSTALTNGKG
jgi:hypothetical protein